eukprot:gene7452-7514_t
MNICFVTCKKLKGLAADDEILVNYLHDRNIGVTAEVWDDDQVDWTKYDAIVLRSTWDYHVKIEQFNVWLDRLTALNCLVLNPVSVIKNNQHKKYLFDLAEKGVLIPPSYFAEQGGTDRISEITRNNSWDRVVVKPAVSGGAYNTWTTTAAAVYADEQRFMEMLHEGDVIVQQFMDGVISDGELSLMFFNKRFSHAILKNAKSGDFRVQQEFGGTSVQVTLSAEVIADVHKLVDSIDESLLFARVDGILTAGNFYLMELELIEPALFIGTSGDHACALFYNAIMELVA